MGMVWVSAKTGNGSSSKICLYKTEIPSFVQPSVCSKIVSK